MWELVRVTIKTNENSSVTYFISLKLLQRIRSTFFVYFFSFHSIRDFVVLFSFPLTTLLCIPNFGAYNIVICNTI